MNRKYWLRGIIVGLVVYILFFAISYVLILGGVITCNIFNTQGPSVKDNILCGPILTLTGLPLMIFGELIEDISSRKITHIGLYLGLVGSMLVYFGIFALGGYLYGKHQKTALCE